MAWWTVNLMCEALSFLDKKNAIFRVIPGKFAIFLKFAMKLLVFRLLKWV